MKTFTKREIAERIADQAGLTQVQAMSVIQLFLDELVAELRAGNRFEFRDAFVLGPANRMARSALNPKTLEKVAVPAKRIVKFKPGKLLKNLPPLPDEPTQPNQNPAL